MNLPIINRLEDGGQMCLSEVIVGQGARPETTANGGACDVSKTHEHK